MKILLTGGGTGGHFYPIVAVAQSLKKIIKNQKLIDAKLFYMAPSPYNERLLYENEITFVTCYAGKVRRYFSLLNVFDVFKTLAGIVKASVNIFNIFPDVVFGKGGYVSFPALIAARLFRIPVVIHESDSKPGRVNKWAGKFAKRIAVSYPQAAAFFPKDKVAHTGNPIRKEIAEPLTEGAHEFFDISKEVPTVVIFGGSQGSQKINDAIIEILPDLVKGYNVIHQTGKNNFDEMVNTAQVVFGDNPDRFRYKPFAYLNDVSMRMAAGVSAVIVSRAGSTIFEIASWGKPSIIIPIPEDVSHDQRSNAFAYASTGACSVIEEFNLAPHILMGEINRIAQNPSVAQKMSEATKAFKHPDAADKIAQEIVAIALTHAS